MPLPFAFALLALGLQAGQPTAADLNRPIPERARRLQQEGRRLAEQEKLVKAEAKFRRALRLAPQFVEAHLDLVRLRVYYLQDLAGAEAEYRAQAAAEPRNPLFPYVLATGLQRFLDAEERIELLRQAAELVPEWSRAREARVLLLWREKKLEEMEQLLATQPELQDGWGQLAREFEKLGRWAKAERFHRKAAELRGDPFSSGAWRLQLKLAEESEAARARLRHELERWQKADLAPRYQRQVAYAYRRLLDDPETAQAIEEAVERDHPKPEEAHSFESGMAQRVLGGEMDEPERILAGGRQARLSSQLSRARREQDVSQKNARIRTLLQERPHPALRRMMQRSLLKAQIEAKDWPGARATLAEIVASKPENIESRFKLALALAENKVHLDEALRLVEEAQALRREFRPWVRPRQFAIREWEKRYGPEDQRQAYNNTLATLADARGWILAEQGNLEQAEQELRSAVSLNSSQQAQYHLGVVLDRRGEREEALDLLVQAAAQKGSLAKDAREAAEALFEKLHGPGVDALIQRARKALVEEKRQELAREFIQEPPKDFELVALDGQSYRLSDLRGKVVLINFWATWCGPCVVEMPTLIRLYQKHRETGFEILAISIDEDKSKVPPFVSEHKLPFPVLLADKVGLLYGVSGVPDNFFIDRAGNLRYHQLGFSETDLEAVVEELLASPPPPTGGELFSGSTSAVSSAAVQDTTTVDVHSM